MDSASIGVRFSRHVSYLKRRHGELLLFFNGSTFAALSKFGTKKSRYSATTLTHTMAGSRQTWILPLVWWISVTAILWQNQDLRRLPYNHRSLLMPEQVDGSESRTNPTASQNNNDRRRRHGLAACLLVMDDNHFLIEWLAYHYFVGPLKSLIVAVDPRSTTNLSSIVERYNDDSELNITVWHHNDYYTKREVQQIQQLVQQQPTGGTLSKNLDVMLHRKRQRIFFDRCLRQHQTNGWTYTLLTDTDEFLLSNYDMAQPTNYTLRPIFEPGSVWHALSQEQDTTADTPHLPPCIQIPRVRFGSVETTTHNDTVVAEEDVQPAELQLRQLTVNASHLATYRW
jgi:hypothetical protein